MNFIRFFKLLSVAAAVLAGLAARADGAEKQDAGTAAGGALEVPAGSAASAGDEVPEQAAGTAASAGDETPQPPRGAPTTTAGDETPDSQSTATAAAPEHETAAAEEETVEPITLEDSPQVTDPLYEDGVPDEVEVPAVVEETPRERLQRVFKLYRDALADSMYAEADTLAKQIVEMTIEMNGINSEETARALTNLAIAQHGMGDYDAAQLNFQSSIEITERISDRLNKDLINPLKGLGAAQVAAGKPLQAVESFERALHVSHVNYGPHNEMQVEVLESLAGTWLAAGEHDKAVDIQERIFAVQARNTDMDSEEVLPALQNQARWLHRLQLYDKERYTWRRIISIIEDHRGRDDLSLIDPLTGLGNSYLYIGLPEVTYSYPTANTSGEIYLKKALRIAEENPEADWRVRSQALLALGDYYLLSDRPNRAERTYRDAWELMSGDAEKLRARHEALESMAVLQAGRPPKIYGVETAMVPQRRPEGFESGSVVYQYSLSTRGRATNIELIDAEPAALEDMQRDVGRELRYLVQRPRLVDGDAVQTDNLTFTHNFYYRESDLPEDADDTDNAT